MKKSILLTAMSLLLFVGLTSMVSMSPPEFDLQSCLTQNENPNHQANCICKLIEESVDSNWENSGYNNFGDCVNVWKEILN